MKKIGLGAVVACLILLVAPTVYGFNKPTNVCQVVALGGAVQVQKEEGGLQKVEIGDYLKKEEAIKTGKGSYVIVSFDPKGGNVIQIGENSFVTIKSMRPYNISVKSGELFAKLKKLKRNDSFKVGTPICVVAVRGTEFQVKQVLIEAKILVFDNQVDVFGLELDGVLRQDSTRLNKGKKVSVASNGQFGVILDLTPTDWLERDQIGNIIRDIQFQKIFRKNPPPKNTEYGSKRDLIPLIPDDIFGDTLRSLNLGGGGDAMSRDITTPPADKPEKKDHGHHSTS